MPLLRLKPTRVPHHGSFIVLPLSQTEDVIQCRILEVGFLGATKPIEEVLWHLDLLADMTEVDWDGDYQTYHLIADEDLLAYCINHVENHQQVRPTTNHPRRGNNSNTQVTNHPRQDTNSNTQSTSNKRPRINSGSGNDTIPDSVSDNRQIKFRKRNSLSRFEVTTLGKGFRFGVATWNTHGLSKKATDASQDALNFKKRLKAIYSIQARFQSWIPTEEDLDPLFNEKQVEQMKNALARISDDRTLVTLEYLNVLIARYDLIHGTTTETTLRGKVKYPKTKTVKQREAAVKSLVGKCKDLKKGTPFRNLLREAIKAIRRRLTCDAIVTLFEKHDWLDALVLQEVKFSGMQMLMDIIGDKVYICPGPMMKSTSGGHGEVEYFPLILPKNRISRNCGVSMNISRIWWINKNGTTGELPSETEFIDDIPVQKFNFKLGGKEPDIGWNKKEDTFRPVVVYDIQLEGHYSAIHLGAIHTTPGNSKIDLSPQEKKSASEFSETSRVRKKQVNSHEFQRLHQYDQVSVTMQQIRNQAFNLMEGQQGYFGPWILAGDYYLFRESRVIDLEVEMGSEIKTDRSEELKRRVVLEFTRRKQDYADTIKDLKSYKKRQTLWTELNNRITLEYNQDHELLPPDLRQLLLKHLCDDDAYLAYLSLYSIPRIRAMVQLMRAYWLDCHRVLKLIDEGNGTFDYTLVDICEFRLKSYKLLVNLCKFYERELNVLSRENIVTVQDMFRALREDNQRHMRRAGAPTQKEGRTKEIGTHISALDDPMRSALGITFQDLEHDTTQDQGMLTISQPISGTNLDKFEKLAVAQSNDFQQPSSNKMIVVSNDGSDEEDDDLEYGIGEDDEDDIVDNEDNNEGDDEDDEKLDNAIQRFYDRKWYVTRLKIADFIVHTRYNSEHNMGGCHWTTSCIGLLCPDVGKIVLADNEDLTTIGYWSAFADHFPVGGLLSTDLSSQELIRLQKKIVRRDATPENDLQKFELIRRRARMVQLQRLARIVCDYCRVSLQDSQLAPIFNIDEYSFNTLANYADINIKTVDTTSAGIIIQDIENILGMPDSDRFSMNGFGIVAEDFGWSGGMTPEHTAQEEDPLDDISLDNLNTNTTVTTNQNQFEDEDSIFENVHNRNMFDLYPGQITEDQILDLNIDPNWLNFDDSIQQPNNNQFVENTDNQNFVPVNIPMGGDFDINPYMTGTIYEQIQLLGFLDNSKETRMNEDNEDL